MTTRTTRELFLNAGAQYEGHTRFVAPTQLWGLIHNLLEFIKHREPDFKMPKVFINIGCRVVFAKVLTVRKAQMEMFNKYVNETKARYDEQANAWKVEAL